MSPRPPSPTSSVHEAGAAADVETLLASVDHPQMAANQALRTLIRGVDPRVRESVKWNSPSFATTEHFATFHLRARAGVRLVLHCGA